MRNSNKANGDGEGNGRLWVQKFSFCSRVPILLFVMVLGCLVLSPSRAQADGSRKSPFFIDGIHCEGLEGLITERDIPYKYPDEVAAVAIKALEQDQCEALFWEYGVKKFQWVTPEDLEKLSFALRHAQKFKSIDIRIEKSELQNHVHLIGRFIPFAKSNFFKLKIKQSLERDSVDGNRQTTDASALIEIGRRGIHNPPAAVATVKYYGTAANHSIRQQRLNDNGRPIVVTPQEKVAQSRHNATYASVNSQFNQSNGYFVGFGVETTRLSADEKTTVDPRVEVGKFFQIDPLLPDDTRLSLIYSEYSATGFDLYDKNWKNRNRNSIAFAGGSQSLENHWFKGKARFYRSLTPELHYFADLEAVASLRGYFSFSQSLGYTMTQVRGAVLPDQRFGLPDRSQDDLFYILEKPHNLLGTENTLGLRLGYANYQAEGRSENPYFRSHIYGEFSIKTRTETFESSFAFLYGDRRLY